MNEKDKFRLNHIAEAIAFIEDHTQESMEKTLLEDLVLRFALERQLEIIGEAVAFLSDELKRAYPSIEWKKITQFRNFLAHEYFGIDYNLVWDILIHKIPELKITINNIIDEYNLR